MRILLLLVILISSSTLKAQTVLPASFIDYTHQRAFLNDLNDSTGNKKWSLSTYSSISTSFSFFKGGNATVVSAPMELQLNRRLNNNLYAFAGVSVAPAYINFNQSFLTANVSKGFQNHGIFKTNGFDIYSRAELGLMYINDEKTFSISGSIGVERSSYPMLPFYPVNTTKPNPVISQKH